MKLIFNIRAGAVRTRAELDGRAADDATLPPTGRRYLPRGGADQARRICFRLRQDGGQLSG